MKIVDFAHILLADQGGDNIHTFDQKWGRLFYLEIFVQILIKSKILLNIF